MGKEDIKKGKKKSCGCVRVYAGARKSRGGRSYKVIDSEGPEGPQKNSLTPLRPKGRWRIVESSASAADPYYSLSQGFQKRAEDVGK